MRHSLELTCVPAPPPQRNACGFLCAYFRSCYYQHVALFTSKHELTFIDNSGRLNLFARMTKNAYEEVHCTLFGPPRSHVRCPIA